MSFTDATRSLWDRNGLVGRWRDRKGKRLENYLDAAMAALVACSVHTKHRLTEEAKRQRRRAEELERRRLQQERREREARRHEFIFKMADEFSAYHKLVALAAFMELNIRGDSNDSFDRFVQELRHLAVATRQRLEREALQEALLKLHLYADDDGNEPDILRSVE